MRFEGQVAQAITNIGKNNVLRRKLNEGVPLEQGESLLPEHVETTDEVIRQFLPEGLGKDLHFNYRGVKVYLKGNKEKENIKTVDEALHGN